MRLSEAQRVFLFILSQSGDAGYLCPFLSKRDDGRAASAWYRTADSLARAGLASLKREGDSKRAFITEAGRAVVLRQQLMQLTAEQRTFLARLAEKKSCGATDTAVEIGCVVRGWARYRSSGFAQGTFEVQLTKAGREILEAGK